MPDPTLGFDLRPPPPNKQVKLLDTLSEQLLSGDHLNVILRDPSFFLRFTAFLNRYRPHSAPVHVRYLEAQKAMKAVEYANLVAHSIKPLPSDPHGQTPCPAASIDMRFEARAKKAFHQLVTEALPAYITQALVKIFTESMIREITGATIPGCKSLSEAWRKCFVYRIRASTTIQSYMLVKVRDLTEDSNNHIWVVQLILLLLLLHSRILPNNTVWTSLCYWPKLPFPSESKVGQTLRDAHERGRKVGPRIFRGAF